MEKNLIYTSEKNLYVQYEHESGSRLNRRCIDGSITGCGNCVGYCQFHEHPGFLTQKQRQEHDCIIKKCHYYIPKPRSNKHEQDEDISSNLLRLAEQNVADIDDIRIMNARQTDQMWVIGYVTVFGQSNFSMVAQKIQEESGVPVTLQKLDYSFDRCVELICDRRS